MSSTDQETATQTVRPRSVVRKYLPSYTTISLIGYFVSSLIMNGDVTPLIKRGFFCNDSSIKYPFKKETISVRMLMLFALVIPGIVIKYCDRYLRRLVKNCPNIPLKIVRRKDSSDSTRDDDKMDDVDGTENVEEKKNPEIDVEAKENSEQKERPESKVGAENSDDGGQDDGGENAPMLPYSSKIIDAVLHSRRRLLKTEQEELGSIHTGNFVAVPLNRDQDAGHSSKLSLILRRTFGDFQLFLFGFCTTMLFTGIGKIVCGRFRPHFLQRCQPDVDCSQSSDHTKYVEDFTCTNTQLTSRDMSYITTSWPSGHAAIMFFSMTYLIIYLERVLSVMAKLKNDRDPKPLISVLMLNGLYVLMIGLAGYIAGTRVTDYHHHALDVVSGALIGFSIALVLTRSIPARVGLA